MFISIAPSNLDIAQSSHTRIKIEPSVPTVAGTPEITPNMVFPTAMVSDILIEAI
jgi:hypothetical protein